MLVQQKKWAKLHLKPFEILIKQFIYKALSSSESLYVNYRMLSDLELRARSNKPDQVLFRVGAKNKQIDLVQLRQKQI